jgi:cytochrome P450
VVRNIWLDPLSKYPGPWYLAASDLPRLFALTRGTYVEWNHQLHLRYGPVVRVGPKELSYTKGQAWKDIYGHNKIELPKDPDFYGTPANGVDHIGTASRADHSRFRSIFSHAFSDRALKRQEPLLLRYAHAMVARMQRTMENDGRVNLSDVYNFAAFDITSELAFGQPLKLLQVSA